MLKSPAIITILVLFVHGKAEDSNKGDCSRFQYDHEMMKKITAIEHDHEMMKCLLSRYQQLADTDLETATILESQETLTQSLRAEIQEIAKTSSSDITSVQEALQSQKSETEELKTANSRDITRMQTELRNQQNAMEETKTTCSRDITSMREELKSQAREIGDLKAKYENLTSGRMVKYRDCAEVLRADKYARSGVYTIYPTSNFHESGLSVYCDMTTQGGGWIVFQRRQNGSENFYRGWGDYKGGFGNLNSEFWLGLDNIHALVSNGNWELLINVRVGEKGEKYALYKTFSVGPESGGYVLTAGDYSGNAGDSLTRMHNGMKFTTKDKDNDTYGANCAVIFTGAWWYRRCHDSNLNGVYGTTGGKGPMWRTLNKTGPVGFVEMKIKQKI